MHNKRKRNREPNIKPFPASIGGDQNYAMQDYNFHDNYNSGINSFGFGYDAYGSGHSRGHPSFYRQNSMIVEHRQYYPITTREKYRNFGKPSNNSSGFESSNSSQFQHQKPHKANSGYRHFGNTFNKRGPESNIVSQFQQQKSSNLHTGSGNFGSTFNNTRGPESNTATQFQQQKSFNVNRGAGIFGDAFNNTRLLEKSNTSMSLYQKADYVKTGTGNFENDFKNTRDLESKKEASPVQQPRADNVKTSKGTYNKNDRKQKAKPNTVEKRLNEMLAAPVDMTKGASMLQKMGWTGGGLGRSGEGIVEPIAPNAAYVTGKGFGTDTPTPKKNRNRQKVKLPSNLTKQERRKIHKQRESELRVKQKAEAVTVRRLFKQEVLEKILEFVQRDDQIELFFEEKLSKNERKIIHKLVEDMREYGEIIAQEEDDVTMMDTTQKIVHANDYVLQTQSEGEVPNRRICIFKEAPDHVYLVTPDDLRYDETSPNACEQKKMDIKRNNKDIKCANKLKPRKIKKSKLKKIEKLLTEKNISEENLPKEKGSHNENQTINIITNVSENSKSPEKTESDDKIFSVPQTRLDVTDVKKSILKENPTQDGIETLENNFFLANICENQDKEVLNVNEQHIDNVVEENLEPVDEQRCDIGSNDLKQNDEIDEAINLVEDYISYDKLTEEESNSNTQYQNNEMVDDNENQSTGTIESFENLDYIDITPEADATENIKAENTVVLTENMVVTRMVEFFIDFDNSEEHTEFRILGKFNEVEFNGLIKFFAFCAQSEIPYCEERRKIEEVWNNDKHYFELRNNRNDTIVIYKIAKNTVQETDPS
ncbi:uncharacterized protein LOC126975047 isoform X2 [Leptidea sinapis]|uniref:uncharacterized protein LOC126975047 isoform X2 n=1 Tax=Leptidea sinapis TaxID=189913 RepID=UPI0021C4A67A|nr:uncharacterized protein LOC126975047 isoform X2 [Leptidea sinapis]